MSHPMEGYEAPYKLFDAREEIKELKKRVAKLEKALQASLKKKAKK